MRKLKKYEKEVEKDAFWFLTEGDLWRAIPDSPLRHGRAAQSLPCVAGAKRSAKAQGLATKPGVFQFVLRNSEFI